jgi:uracil permease
MAKTAETKPTALVGYLPQDVPPFGALVSLGLQQFLTMFPATVLVAIITHFSISVTLIASGVGTIVALLVSGRRIPMYYGSSFSYISVILAAMSSIDPKCMETAGAGYQVCTNAIPVIQVGIICTGVLEILIGLLIMRIGKEALDKVLPPVITGSIAIVIGIALAGTALSQAASNWPVAFITLFATIVFSVYLQGKGLIGMLPILLGAAVGWLVSFFFFRSILPLENFTNAKWLMDFKEFTLPNFAYPGVWGWAISIALIAIATVPESTAHLYQMSLYVDQLAVEVGKKPLEIKKLIGLNLVADGSDDIVVGMMGGCAGTNYGENNSLMAITRNYSVAVLFCAALFAIGLGFIGKLSGAVHTLPTAVVGGLSIYLFGVIGMQGVALIQSEKVNLFDPKQLAVGATVLVMGIGGQFFRYIGAKDANAITPVNEIPYGVYDIKIPGIFPGGIPNIIFAALVGILLNAVFLILKPSKLGIKERANINA